MPSLLETVTSLLRQGDNLNRLGVLLDTDTDRAAALVDLATPVLITGLADRAFEPGGSDIVVRLLDGIDPSIVDNPLVFVERGDATIGEGLLLSIFAGEHVDLRSALARQGDVPESVITRLLPGILALAIGVLGRRRAVRGVDEAGVLELLAAEKSSLPADRLPDGGSVDHDANRNRIPAMAGAAAVETSSSNVSTRAAVSTVGPGDHGAETESRSKPTSNTGTDVADGVPSAKGDPDDPSDQSDQSDQSDRSDRSDRSSTGGKPRSGSAEPDGRGSWLLIVGGVAAVVLLAWALSRFGGGDSTGIEARGAEADTSSVEDPDGAADGADENEPAIVEQSEVADDTETEAPATEDVVETGEESVEPVTINEELSLDPVTFEVGSATITDEGLAVLDEAAEYLKADPEVTVEIAGHTDSDGDAADNIRLSQARAEEVEAYLESQGIDGARMTPVGYGEDDPIASNASEAGKAQNRRIEFVIQ